MSDNKNNSSHDDGFQPWSIIGLDQCGSERYVKSKETEADTFKLFHEQGNKDEDDSFSRLYEPGEKEDDLNDIDNEFKPFHSSAYAFNAKAAETAAEMDKGGSSAGKTNTSGGTEESQFPGSSGVDALNTDEFVAINAGGAQAAAGGSQSVAGGHQAAEKDISPLLKVEGEMAVEEGLNSGFEQDKKQGYDEGFSQGREEGEQKGYKSGLEKGEQEGYESGLEKGEQEGYESGLEKGEHDGKMLSDAKTLELISSLEDICRKTEQAWQNTVNKHENRIISLICKIAEKVAFTKIELAGDVVRESVLQALAVMPEPEEITLNISPDDYEYIEMIKDDFFEKFKSLKNVAVISNPSVQIGGCKIESSKARVETDVASRIEAVAASIMAIQVT